MTSSFRIGDDDRSMDVEFMISQDTNLASVVIRSSHELTKSHIIFVLHKVIEDLLREDRATKN